MLRTGLISVSLVYWTGGSIYRACVPQRSVLSAGKWISKFALCSLENRLPTSSRQANSPQHSLATICPQGIHANRMSMIIYRLNAEGRFREFDLQLLSQKTPLKLAVSCAQFQNQPVELEKASAHCRTLSRMGDSWTRKTKVGSILSR